MSEHRYPVELYKEPQVESVSVAAGPRWTKPWPDPEVLQKHLEMGILLLLLFVLQQHW